MEWAALWGCALPQLGVYKQVTWESPGEGEAEWMTLMEVIGLRFSHGKLSCFPNMNAVLVMGFVLFCFLSPHTEILRSTNLIILLEDEIFADFFNTFLSLPVSIVRLKFKCFIDSWIINLTELSALLLFSLFTKFLIKCKLFQLEPINMNQNPLYNLRELPNMNTTKFSRLSLLNCLLTVQSHLPSHQRLIPSALVTAILHWLSAPAIPHLQTSLPISA